jgi:predicted Zn-dependent peptidase
MKDLYAILGLTPGATPAEIKVAYRRLARKCHPDVSASPDANARFAEINEAYHVLSDAHQRWAYDHGLYAEQRTFYASRQSEVVAKQRHFDRLVDEWIAHSRQEEAARADAVLLVVPLFLSTFYVMASKPDFIEQSALLGRPFDYVETLPARYAALTPEQLMAEARRALHPDRFVWVVVGDAAKVRPQLDTLGLPIELAPPQ